MVESLEFDTTFSVDAVARPGRHLLGSRQGATGSGAAFHGFANRCRRPVFWDKEYNNGTLLDGVDSMRRSISHRMFP
jgi:hypothetical protein